MNQAPQHIASPVASHTSWFRFLWHQIKFVQAPLLLLATTIKNASRNVWRWQARTALLLLIATTIKNTSRDVWRWQVRMRGAFMPDLTFFASFLCQDKKEEPITNKAQPTLIKAIMTVLAIMLAIASIAQSQVIYADTTKLKKRTSSTGNELQLENSTRAVKGFLLNHDGAGNTRFAPGIDTIYSSNDTLYWRFTNDNNLFYKILNGGTYSNGNGIKIESGVIRWADTIGNTEITVKPDSIFRIKSADPDASFAETYLNKTDWYAQYGNPATNLSGGIGVSLDQAYLFSGADNHIIDFTLDSLNGAVFKEMDNGPGHTWPFRGIRYVNLNPAEWTSATLVPKGYVDSILATAGLTYIAGNGLTESPARTFNVGGLLTGNISFNGAGGYYGIDGFNLASFNAETADVLNGSNNNRSGFGVIDYGTYLRSSVVSPSNVAVQKSEIKTNVDATRASIELGLYKGIGSSTWGQFSALKMYDNEFSFLYDSLVVNMPENSYGSHARYLPLSVNGQYAGDDGNITIPAGATYTAGNGIKSSDLTNSNIVRWADTINAVTDIKLSDASVQQMTFTSGNSEIAQIGIRRDPGNGRRAQLNSSSGNFNNTLQVKYYETVLSAQNTSDDTKSARFRIAQGGLGPAYSMAELKGGRAYIYFDSLYLLNYNSGIPIGSTATTSNFKVLMRDQATGSVVTGDPSLFGTTYTAGAGIQIDGSTIRWKQTLNQYLGMALNGNTVSFNNSSNTAGSAFYATTDSDGSGFHTQNSGSGGNFLAKAASNEASVYGTLDGSDSKYKLIMGAKDSIYLKSGSDVGLYLNTASPYLKNISSTTGYKLLYVNENTGAIVTSDPSLVGGGSGVTSVTGTADRITSTGGTTPVIDIAATYVGQPSINTVGTLTTGTYQATPIADAYISSAATWNAKQAALSGTGLVKSTAGTISYITDNTSDWNTAFGWGDHSTAGYFLASNFNSSFDTRLGTKTTDDLAEGANNKYFSNTLARNAISVSGSLSYNSGTGVISYTQPTNVSTFTNDANYTSGTGTSGYIPYYNGSTTFGNSANLFWDATNSRLGINTTAPTHSLTFGNSSNGIYHYNTSDQTGNFERHKGAWASNIYEIGNEYGGTGTTTRALRIGIVATAGSTIANGRNMLFQGAAPFISLNSGSTGITGVLTAVTGTYQASSGIQQAFGIYPTINQSGTAGYNNLYISPYEQSTGSGTKYLINAGTNTAANNGGTHNPMFVLDKSGNGYFAGVVGINNATPAASAQLDIASTTRGFLLPRMTGTQRDAINSPANGLQLYNTTTSTLNYYASARWNNIATNSLIAASGTTGAVTANLENVSAYTVTPTGDITFSTSNGVSGQRVAFIITTAGTTSYTITFGTNFKSTGTITTGTVDGKIFTVEFVFNGTNWCELSRTVAM